MKKEIKSRHYTTQDFYNDFIKGQPRYWMEFLKNGIENIIYLNAHNNNGAIFHAKKIAEREGVHHFNIKYVNYKNGKVVEVITDRLKGLNHEYRI